ncbi:MAG: tRNA lysidine(34) synthetase TilS [Opitutales bacterium]|nr:tRNA lysidine(34) synthetase TilS [Opitutales bacterium]
MNNHPGENTPRVIAVSGGADSVALLLLLWAHFPAHRPYMFVAHFNHRLRPDADDGESAYVSDLAQGLGLPFISGEWECSHGASVTEEAARDARYAFLLNCFSGQQAIWIFTGHHRRDVAETLLMRAGRGSSPESLAAPKAVQLFSDGHIRLRPLLTLDPDFLKNCLERSGVSWCEDASNHTLQYTRNRIRHQVMPLLDEILGRSFEQGGVRTHELLQEVDDYLCEWLMQADVRSFIESDTLHMNELSVYHRFLRRRIFREWMQFNEAGNLLSAKAEDWFLQEGAHGSFTLGPSCVLQKQNGNVYLEREPSEYVYVPFALSIPLVCSVFFPNGTAFYSELVPVDDALMAYLRSGQSDPAVEAWLACDADTVLFLRNRREGDSYSPMGSGASVLLQNAFINRKIPAGERNSLPVVCIGSRIAWVPGLIPHELFKLKSGCKLALKLTYMPILTR